MHERTIGRPGTDWDPFETLVDVLTAATRYDLVLGIVPLAFTVALVVAHVAGVPLAWALALAAVVGLTAIADAVFLHPPVDQEVTDRSPTTQRPRERDRPT